MLAGYNNQLFGNAWVVVQLCVYVCGTVLDIQELLINHLPLQNYNSICGDRRAV